MHDSNTTTYAIASSPNEIEEDQLTARQGLRIPSSIPIPPHKEVALTLPPHYGASTSPLLSFLSHGLTFTPPSINL